MLRVALLQHQPPFAHTRAPLTLSKTLSLSIFIYIYICTSTWVLRPGHSTVKGTRGAFVICLRREYIQKKSFIIIIIIIIYVCTYNTGTIYRIQISDRLLRQCLSSETHSDGGRTSLTGKRVELMKRSMAVGSI